MSKKRTSLMTENGTSVKTKKGTSGRVKNGHPDVQELGSNYIEGNKTEYSHTESSYTDFNIEEEEKEILKEINPYFPSLIKEVLGADGIYDDLMIARIILEMKNNKLSFLTKKEMITQHRKMVQKQVNGEAIWDWAKYFVGGIMKNRLSEDTATNQSRLEEIKKFYAYTNNQNHSVTSVPFYNWLEKY